LFEFRIGDLGSNMPEEVKSRFVGCLLDGASGDALGAPWNSMSRRQIEERFGASGIS
jgi:ADP-ribosylglycohydrolase